MLTPGRQGVKEVSLACMTRWPLRHTQPFLRSLVGPLFLLPGDAGPLSKRDLLTWIWKQRGLSVCLSVLRGEEEKGGEDMGEERKRRERRGQEVINWLINTRASSILRLFRPTKTKWFSLWNGSTETGQVHSGMTTLPHPSEESSQDPMQP